MSEHQVGANMRTSVGKRPNSGVKKVNKFFLFNTVVGLKSHNRREEEEDCWRQHRLQEQQHQQRRETEGLDLRNLINQRRSGRRGAVGSASVNSREFWAEMKLRARASNSDSAGGTTQARRLSSHDKSCNDVDVGAARNIAKGDKPVSQVGGNKKTRHKRARETRDSGDEDNGHDRCKHMRKQARDRNAEKRKKRKNGVKAYKKKR